AGIGTADIVHALGRPAGARRQTRENRSMSMRHYLLVLAAVLLAPLSAHAQYGTGPGGRAPYERRDQERNVPGRFDYYSLVLSWSPTFCASLPRDRYGPQCHRRDGRRCAFVLHGL